jgi:hypothetical protein
MAVIDSSESISRVKLVDAEGQVIPLNILIYSGSGGGKTVAEEEIADYYHRHGWTIISLSDVKDELELWMPNRQATDKDSSPIHIRYT